MNTRLQSAGLGLAALALAAAVWLPCVHLLFATNQSSPPDKRGVTPQARQLAARHLQLWNDPALKRQELDRMRRTNPEWDFMGRSILVWSLAEMALREPGLKTNYLPVIDQIIDDTLRLEHDGGIHVFLMPYAKWRAFLAQPARSLFVDGEISLMLALRRMVEEKPEYRALLAERVTAMTGRLRQSPALAAESYPNECWMFDHAVALAGIRLSDRLDGGDHSALFRDWLGMAKKNLIHPATGLLVSSFTVNGEPLDGPEGSSIWMAAHCLSLIDEEFARDQYERARREMGRELLGFAWSREWPVSWRGPGDVDSGAVIPILDVSAGGSGLAFIGASSFRDEKFLTRLHTTLDFAAFPLARQGRLKYCASNQVGDAVMLYACVLGPAWARAKGK